MNTDTEQSNRKSGDGGKRKAEGCAPLNID